MKSPIKSTQRISANNEHQKKWGSEFSRENASQKSESMASYLEKPIRDNVQKDLSSSINKWTDIYQHTNEKLGYSNKENWKDSLDHHQPEDEKLYFRKKTEDLSDMDSQRESSWGFNHSNNVERINKANGSQLDNKKNRGYLTSDRKDVGIERSEISNDYPSHPEFKSRSQYFEEMGRLNNDSSRMSFNESESNSISMKTINNYQYVAAAKKRQPAPTDLYQASSCREEASYDAKEISSPVYLNKSGHIDAGGDLITPIQAKKERNSPQFSWMSPKKLDLSSEKEKETHGLMRSQDFNKMKALGLYTSSNTNEKEKKTSTDNKSAQKTSNQGIDQSEDMKADKEKDPSKVGVEKSGETSETMVKLDVLNIFKKYEEYARSKAPKLIKKFQKYIKKLGRQVKGVDIKDEEILKLKHEVEHMRDWNKSWSYSRILLYLYNTLYFFKYNHEMDSKKISEKAYKTAAKITKKAFCYAREIIRLLCIKFEQEEIEAFHRVRREYRILLQNKAKKFTEQNKKMDKEQQKAEPKKKKKHEKEQEPEKIEKKIEKQTQEQEQDIQPQEEEKPQKQRIQPKRQATHLPESKPIKKVKIESSGEESDDDHLEQEYIPKASERDEIPSKVKAGGKKKKKRFFRNRIPVPVKKEEKMEEQDSMLLPEEIREEIEVRKKLHEYAKKLAMHLRSEGYYEVMLKQLQSWKKRPEEPNEAKAIVSTVSVSQKPEKKTFTLEKIEKAAINEKEEGESPTETLKIPSFSLFADEPKKTPPPPKLSIFDDEGDSTTEETVCPPTTSTSKRSYDMLAKIFQPEFSPAVLNLKRNLKIDFTDCMIDFDSQFEKKTSVIFFCNEIEKRLRGFLKLKGIHHQFNLDYFQNPILSKLVLLQLKLGQDREISEEEKEEPYKENQIKQPTIKVHNSVSADTFDSFMKLSDKRKSHAFVLNNYEELFQPWEKLRKAEEIQFIETILRQVSKDEWNFDPKFGAYYYALPSKDYIGGSYSHNWDIGMLLPVENFFSFHIEINGKLIF